MGTDSRARSSDMMRRTATLFLYLAVLGCVDSLDRRGADWSVVGLAKFEDVKFSQITAGWDHDCGIIKDTGEVECWGADWASNGLAEFNGVKFSQITAGWDHACGITKDTEEVKCWGADLKEQGATGAKKFEGVKFSQIP